MSNFCFGVPSDSFIGWRLTQYQVEDQAFFGLTGKPDLKKFYLFKDKSFWLEIFFIFQGYTRATFLYTFRSRWTSGKFSGWIWRGMPIHFYACGDPKIFTKIGLSQQENSSTSSFLHMSNLSTSSTKLSNKKFKISVPWGPFKPLKMVVPKEVKN